MQDVAPVYTPWRAPLRPKPKVWFPEKFCRELAIWGQYTVNSDGFSLGSHPDAAGVFGRWTYHFDPPTKSYEQRAVEGFPHISEVLPGTRLRWEDWGTNQSWLWVLTDQVVTTPVGAPPGGEFDTRLGVWPD